MQCCKKCLWKVSIITHAIDIIALLTLLQIEVKWLWFLLVFSLEGSIRELTMNNVYGQRERERERETEIENFYQFV